MFSHPHIFSLASLPLASLFDRVSAAHPLSILPTASRPSRLLIPTPDSPAHPPPRRPVLNHADPRRATTLHPPTTATHPAPRQPCPPTPLPLSTASLPHTHPHLPQPTTADPATHDEADDGTRPRRGQDDPDGWPPMGGHAVPPATDDQRTRRSRRVASDERTRGPSGDRRVCRCRGCTSRLLCVAPLGAPITEPPLRGGVGCDNARRAQIARLMS